MPAEPPVIVIRRKVLAAGHHGGAWKVAYADFVTAMMALFILLWLMSASSKHTQQMIASYFRDPLSASKLMGSNALGSSQNIALDRDRMEHLKQTLMQSIQHASDLKQLKQQIEMTITPEGLRIELLEDPKGTFFRSGSTVPTPALVELLKLLAGQLGKLPNRVSIEGHTDAAPYSGTQVYSNWELSTDRANVARRLMQASGLHGNQVSQVRGFAAERLRDPQHPFAASNRRISLIVEWANAPSAPPVEAAATADSPATPTIAKGAAKYAQRGKTNSAAREGNAEHPETGDSNSLMSK